MRLSHFKLVSALINPLIIGVTSQFWYHFWLPVGLFSVSVVPHVHKLVQLSHVISLELDKIRDLKKTHL